MNWSEGALATSRYRFLHAGGGRVASFVTGGGPGPGGFLLRPSLPPSVRDEKLLWKIHFQAGERKNHPLWRSKFSIREIRAIIFSEHFDLSPCSTRD